MNQLKIALIGYGKMGHIIERIALERGHSIALTIDAGQEELFESEAFRTCDVAIEFTRPDAAFANCQRALEAQVPVVSGTTGWAQQLQQLQARCEQGEGTLFWSSNFSVGVYLFNKLNAYLAQLTKPFAQYRPLLEETHHIHKLDAPSGTAVTLAETLLRERPELQGWQLCTADEAQPSDQLPIIAYREGEVPGTHTISYSSAVDTLRITHEAFGREGFALGAVLAAEYASQHRGWLTMDDMMQDTSLS